MDWERRSAKAPNRTLYEGLAEADFLGRMVRNFHDITGLGLTQFTLLSRSDQAHRDTVWSEDHPKIMEEYRDYVFPQDPRMAAYAACVGRFHACWEVVDTEALEAMDFIGAWADRKDVDKRWGAASVWPIDHEQLGVLAVVRPRREGAYDLKELRLAERLKEHVRRAAQLHLFLANHREHGRAVSHAWGSGTTPVFLIGTGRRILSMNEAAEVMVQRCDVVQARWGLLCALNDFETRALDHALSAAALHGLFIPQGTLQVPLQGFGGQMAWAADIIAVAPVQQELGLNSAVRAIVTLREVRSKSDAMVRRLLFLGLSRPQALAVRAFRQYNDIPQASQMLGLTPRALRRLLRGALERLGCQDWMEFVTRAGI